MADEMNRDMMDREMKGTKKRCEAQAELAKIEDELKQAMLQAGHKV